MVSIVLIRLFFFLFSFFFPFCDFSFEALSDFAYFPPLLLSILSLVLVD